MNPLPAVPGPMRWLLSRLPQYPASAAFAAVMTLALGNTLGANAHPELAGKVIRVRVTDLGLTHTFRVMARGFAPTTAARADVTFSAHAEDFLALALRTEDPDTLFFGRRLSIEGDSELGLFVKNTLDAMELKPPFATLRDLFLRLKSGRT